MEKTKKKTDLVVMLDDFKKIEELENKSALTIEGCVVDEQEVKAIIKFFKKSLKNEEPTIYVIKGEVMNKYCGLTGKNAYKKDLNIVVIDLDEFNMEELMKLRIEFFGLFRWLDDVCANNRRRENK